MENMVCRFAIGVSLLFVAVVGCGEVAPGGGGNGAEEETSRHLKYIRSGEYTKLVGEVDYVEGAGPESRVIDSIGEEFRDLLEKPDGIAFERDETIESRGEDHTWTRGELDEVAEETFDREVSSDTIKMHVLYLDGNWEGDSDDSKVLGLAWDHRNIAIFKETIEESCESATLGLSPFESGLCQTVEKSVLVHEIGHTIGLVANGLEPVDDHHDEEHGAHCDNDECVMYWQNRRSDVVERIADRFMNDNEDALGFDENCREDVANVR